MAERKKPKADTEAIRPANDTVGATLRAARLAQGLEIEAVSQVIHIRSAQLKAIEENNIESLPGMTYAVGFVRSYANFLGLNGAEIVHRFKAEHGHTPAQSKLSFPEPIAESRVPDPMMVGVGAFLAVLILVLWTIYSNMHSGSKTAENPPPAPEVTSVAESLPSATATTPATMNMTGAATTPAPDATAQPATPVTTAEQQPAAPVATATPATPAIETPKAEPAKAAVAKKEATSDDSEDATDEEDAPEAKKVSNDDGVINIKRGKSRITLKATEASWVQVSDANQKVLYRKVLRPGEQYSVPDQPGLVLDTANAGGLKIMVDGRLVRAIGKEGDILRGVAMDPQELKGQRD